MMKQGTPARPRAPGALMRAIRFLGGHKRTTAIAYSALIVATLAQLVVPVLVQNMIDTVTLASQTGGDIRTAEGLVFNAAGLILLFALLRGAFSFVQAFMAETTSQGLAFDLRNAIFAKIQRLSFSYYDRNQTGQLMIRATDDVERLRTFIAQGLVLAASSFLLLTGALIILAFTNLRLTFVVMPLLPIALALFIFFGRVSQPLFAVVQERLSALNTILQENLAGLKVVRAFAREPYEEQRFDVAATNLMAQQLRINQVFSFLFPVIFLVAQLGQVAILYFGGRQILGGTLELGGYQKFSLYLTYVFVPLGQLGFIITLVAQASASARRIFEVLDAQSEIEDKPGALPLPLLNGRVEFRNVTFRYLGTGDPVLKEVSFVAEPGQTIALLGATGSGKTTIINLLPRFYDASEGAVLIDGHDVRDVTLDSLRSQIGIVLQETNLFSGTVRDNIAFGRPEATEAEVEAAARAAAAHSFIAAMPEGYQTKVGERGVTLSGGQKQRIAIARALLLDPRLLILDDSTSSVDLQTEATIQQALDTLMEGRTSVVIAQRISTVLRADQILVLDQGRIAAAGTHAELMEHSPIYAEIYHSQLVKETNL
ncbi:ABC transporter ATP-binding protein [Candidatus Chloroploca asiatica]|uniref:ABC transporter ATP-binding protein n=1 Tax=Candidatus Chloroploca asiatica TaxID=1506545 RepID=A0A2H3KPE8_9CHLR|nr:ABC transporter ATP-binding protein [Candidatus Chloroploca asiatica]PDW00122.1 ABC transporter ATP-binding protein [Candidatus Chloroploca asiatica]